MRTTLLFLSLGLVWSQSKDITGSWVGKTQGPGGEQEVAYRFKVEGGKITGVQLTNFGDQPITDGKFTGDDFEFVVEREFFGNIQKITSKGKIDGDSLVITPGMPPPGLAVRVGQVDLGRVVALVVPVALVGRAAASAPVALVVGPEVPVVPVAACAGRWVR